MRDDTTRLAEDIFARLVAGERTTKIYNTADLPRSSPDRDAREVRDATISSHFSEDVGDHAEELALIALESAHAFERVLNGTATSISPIRLFAAQMRIEKGMPSAPQGDTSPEIVDGLRDLSSALKG